MLSAWALNYAPETNFLMMLLWLTDSGNNLTLPFLPSLSPWGQVAQTWTMLRIIYSSPGTVPSANLNHSLGKGSTSLPLMNR